MALRLRLRGPSGGATINVPAGSSAAVLESLVRDALGFGASGAVELLGGHPPKPITVLPDGEPLISSGDTLVVRHVTAADDKPYPSPASLYDSWQAQPDGNTVQSAQAVTGGAPVTTEEEGEEAMLARAIALSKGDAAQPEPLPANAAADGGGGEQDSNGGSEHLVRRVVPADNSCLFVAVALALEGGERARAKALREVVAHAVLADPERFSEAVLSRPPAEYARWILDNEHWGGGIELAVLAEHYRTELGAVDCQTQRVDLFGQGRGYTDRVLLIYDGVHYDLLARSPFAGAPPDFDVRVFSAQDEGVIAEAVKFAQRVQQAGDFTDTASFTIRCLVCQHGLKGQADAVKHAKATGHTNFSEFKE